MSSKLSIIFTQNDQHSYHSGALKMLHSFHIEEKSYKFLLEINCYLSKTHSCDFFRLENFSEFSQNFVNQTNLINSGDTPIKFSRT